MQSDISDTQPSVVNARRERLIRGLWVLLAIFFILAMGVAGSVTGHQSAPQQIHHLQTLEVLKALEAQYVMGVEEMEGGQYELARQRLEYVLAHDPNFPGAAEKLLQILQILNATATPTAIPPTPTLTPTPDLRPIEDLFNQAQSLFLQQDWNGVLDTVLALRKVDPTYRVVEVDDLIYHTLRSRGLDKIRTEGNLEGGIYDLALAERFGPLDVEATRWRNLARLYMIGSGFWEVYPEQAVYYFSQVAAAAPGLRDGSGWTAKERYRASLLQYGDWLARRGDWCNAQKQYDLAASLRGDVSLQATAVYAALQCSPPTVPATPTATFTLTPTETLAPTQEPQPTATPTAALPSPTAIIPTPTPPATATLTPTLPPPTPTPTVEVLPTLTETPVPPTPTETQPPTAP